jgi:hypothetical protein
MKSEASLLSGHRSLTSLVTEIRMFAFTGMSCSGTKETPRRISSSMKRPLGVTFTSLSVPAVVS